MSQNYTTLFDTPQVPLWAHLSIPQHALKTEVIFCVRGVMSPPYRSNRTAKVICWIRRLLSTCRPKLKFGTFTTDDGQRSQNSEQIHIIALGDAREIAWRPGGA